MIQITDTKKDRWTASTLIELLLAIAILVIVLIGTSTIYVSGTRQNDKTTVQSVAEVTGKELFYNVLDYGAVGDGKTDDTFAIQAAIDQADAAGGGWVVLPYGVYKVTDTIILCKNLRLSGPAGRYYDSSWVIKYNDGDCFALSYASDTITGIQIENLRVLADLSCTKGDGFDLEHCANVSFNNVMSILFNEDGFEITDGWGLWMRDCYAGGNSQYSYNINSAHPSLFECIGETSNIGLHLGPVSVNANITDCHWEQNNTAGIKVYGNEIFGTQVKGCFFINTPRGIAVEAGVSKDFQIVANKFYGNKTRGSAAIRITDKDTKNFIASENIVSNYDIGMYYAGGGNLVCTGNHFDVNSIALIINSSDVDEPVIVSGNILEGKKDSILLLAGNVTMLGANKLSADPNIRGGSVIGPYTDTAGNVGIGTVFPSAELDVAGDMSVSGVSDLNDVRTMGATLYSVRAFNLNDSTPSVAGGTVFKTANSGFVTITNFDDGTIGQEIKVVFADPCTIVDFTGTNLKSRYRDTDWKPEQYEYMECIYDGAYWYCEVHD